MREIGGYIELDNYKGNEYYQNAIALNCGRGCISYLIRAKKIKKLFLPYFICGSVVNACKSSNVETEFYHIDESFKPVFNKSLTENEYLYIVNFYDQLSNEKLSEFKKNFGNVIVDNAQAFFRQPIKDVDTLYTCRKFFGVTDGGYLFTNSRCQENFEQDISFNRMKYLLGRFETNASGFYADYAANDDLFDTEPIKQMSKLTHNLLCGIDYRSVAKTRTENFRFLNERLCNLNQLKLTVPFGAYMYPLKIENGASVRKKLQRQKIYIPTLWSDVFERDGCSALEYDFSQNILPLPVDQRYTTEDMQYVIDCLTACC